MSIWKKVDGSKCRREDAYAIIIGIAIVAYIMPVVVSSAYSVFVSDDIAIANVVKDCSNGWEQLIASFKLCLEWYMTWQGTYLAIFMNAFLNPVNKYGMTQLSVTMMFNSILFFGTLFFLVWILTKAFIKENDVLCLSVYGCLIYMTISYNVYEEIFFWFSGAVTYSIPLSIAFLGFGEGLLYQQTKKRKHLLIASVLGIIAMGGSLSIAGFGCYICLLMCFYMFIKNRKIDRINIFILGIWLMGATLNAIAPGNYVRHAIIDESGCHPLNALKIAVTKCSECVHWYTSNTDFIAILGIILLIGLIYGKNRKVDKEYMIVSVLGLLLPVITAFPVVLGYSGADYYPSRCRFVLDMSIILALSNLAFVAGNYVRNMFEDEENVKVLCVGIVLGLFAFVNLDNYNSTYDNNKVLSHYEQLKDGKYKTYHDDCVEFYSSLENRENEDVIISIEDFPTGVPNLYGLSIDENPSDWKNQAISEFYNLNSISVMTSESDY